MKKIKEESRIDDWFKNPGECLIIAEVGSTHDGDLDLAKRLIDAVAYAGADWVKFQTHIAEAETLKNAPPPPFFKSEPRYQYFQRTAFSREEWGELKRYSESVNLGFLSSSFSIEAVELLDAIDVQLHKVPSGEVTNLPYLEHLAEVGKPVILSSGMSNWAELDAAVEVFKKHDVPLVILQCTTEYPVAPENVGLNLLSEISSRYGTLSGLSDHSLHNYAAFAAVAQGAKVIEKHITLSREMHGSDAKHSLLPQEFKQLVDGIRIIERILSSPRDKDDIEGMQEMRQVFQKSVVTARKISKGSTIQVEDLTTKKPGTGIMPREIDSIVGKKARIDFEVDHLINWCEIE